MRRARFPLAVLTVLLLVVPAAADAKPLTFGKPLTVATGVETPAIAASGGGGRIAWIARSSGEEDRIATVALPLDGSIGPEVTLATADSNGIGQPSTALSQPQVAAAAPSSAAVLWTESTAGGPAGTDALTFGASRFVGRAPATSVVHPTGRAVGGRLIVDVDKTIIPVWKDAEGGISVANLTPEGTLESPRQLVPPGRETVQPLGLARITFDQSLIFTESSSNGIADAVSSVPLDAKKTRRPTSLMRSTAKHLYSSFVAAGERIFAFERSRGASYLVAARPRGQGGVTRLARLPGKGLPLDLQAAATERHPSTTALVWTTRNREVYEAVPGPRDAAVRLLTPGRRDGRGAGVAIDQGGRATVVWRDGPNGHQDQILAVQLNVNGKPGNVVNVSGGSRGLGAQVAIGPKNAPEVIWNERGGRLQLSRAAD